jgi:fatty-acyl-CoA synthase
MPFVPAPSYVHGASQVPLLGETIGQNLRRTVERVGDREALVVRHQGYRATYAELWAQTTRAARGLLAHGVSKGDRVGIWSPNRAEWVVLQYATARIGAILVNINPAYKTAELSYALQQSGTSLLLLARGFRTADYVAMLDEVRFRCPDLRASLVLDDDWERLLADGDRVPLADLEALEASLQFDDPINIQYTSGTTGFPKGATLSHHNILNNGFFIGEALHYSADDRVCIPVPFYHCFGMVLGNLACTTHGACMVVPGEGYEPLAVMETVQAERCTSLYGVPTMFIGELDHARFEEFDFSSLRTGIMAGSPCPVEVMKKVQALMHMPEVTICYGMTETSPVSTQSLTDDPLEKRVATVGRIHPHVEIKIVDPADGQIVPRGATGELCTRGYSVMLGYWNNPEASSEAIDSARWMHTGDLATMDDEGYVNIVGRIKDMIIRGGENVYPREIEEFLYGHPDISDVQVIGVPSARYGEEVMAWIRVREGAELTDEALTAFCRGKIATFKIPRYWKFVDSFPMTVTGKIQKFKMREAAVAELGLEQAAAVVTARPLLSEVRPFTVRTSLGPRPRSA